MFEAAKEVYDTPPAKVKTKTTSLSSLSDYQGKSKKLLFVCSVGLLRSPTAMNVAIHRGYNARCCGTDKMALIPINENLISWADKIFFVNSENYWNCEKIFDKFSFDEIREKSEIWNLPDEFDYMDKQLIKWIEFYLDDFES